VIVRFTAPANPEHSPERVLWTLRKRGRIAEARTRIVPVRDGVPELRIYVSKGPTVQVTDLLWSCTLTAGRDVGALSEERRAAFKERGWIDVDRARQSRCGSEE
jgi:hypothetical protein